MKAVRTSDGHYVWLDYEVIYPSMALRECFEACPDLGEAPLQGQALGEAGQQPCANPSLRCMGGPACGPGVPTCAPELPMRLDTLTHILAYCYHVGCFTNRISRDEPHPLRARWAPHLLQELSWGQLMEFAQAVKYLDIPPLYLLVKREVARRIRLHCKPSDVMAALGIQPPTAAQWAAFLQKEGWIRGDETGMDRQAQPGPSGSA